MIKEIEIPEGHEARIEGNRVIIEPKESEDERIRKVIRLALIASEDELSVFYKTHNITRKECTDWFEKQKEQKPAEWSKEDEGMLNCIIATLCEESHGGREANDKMVTWLENLLKSLRPQPKQESEPIEIKYAGKIYKVYGTKELPGGVVGYIIEDEPGHFDYIIHPEEVLGGGYGIKSNGSPYPTKEANFGQPHWKPSKEQMDHLAYAYTQLKLQKCYAPHVYESLGSLYDDLQKHFSL